MANGKFEVNPPVYNGTQQGMLPVSINNRGFVHATMPPLLLHSTTTGTAGTGAWITGLGGFRDATVFIDVTATGGSAALTTFFIDTRLDGTSTANLGASAALGSGTQYILHLSKGHNATLGLTVADAAAGTIRAHGWADDMRVRVTQAGTNPTATYRVWVNVVG